MHFHTLIIHWGGGSTVVSVWACKPRVSSLSPNIPQVTFLSLVLLLSGQRLPKFQPYTVLRRDLQCYMHLRL